MVEPWCWGTVNMAQHCKNFSPVKATTHNNYTPLTPSPRGGAISWLALSANNRAGLESGVWCLESGVWCLVSGVWCLVSGVWSQGFSIEP